MPLKMDYTLIGSIVERTLTLQGAPMRWRSESGHNDLYIPGARIVGPEPACRAWLKQHGYDVESMLAPDGKKGCRTVNS
jgi:hypothetical protein